MLRLRAIGANPPGPSVRTSRNASRHSYTTGELHSHSRHCGTRRRRRGNRGPAGSIIHFSTGFGISASLKGLLLRQSRLVAYESSCLVTCIFTSSKAHKNISREYCRGQVISVFLYHNASTINYIRHAAAHRQQKQQAHKPPPRAWKMHQIAGSPQ